MIGSGGGGTMSSQQLKNSKGDENNPIHRLSKENSSG
jgi:hypothetical protein